MTDKPLGTTATSSQGTSRLTREQMIDLAVQGVVADQDGWLALSEIGWCLKHRPFDWSLSQEFIGATHRKFDELNRND